MTTSTTPLFGRAWKLSVKTSDGNETILTQSSFDPEALRVVFEVLETTLPSPFWFADITVYNLNDPTQQNLLYNAAWITLEAGYQSGDSKSSIIWDGPVLQVLFNRENVVDQTMRFNCVAGPQLLTENFVNISAGPQSSQYDAVSSMISQSNGNPSQQVSSMAKDKLQAKAYPRGKTFFGKVSKYISQMANDNFLNTWLKSNQQYISQLSGTSFTPDLTFSPPFPPDHTQVQPDASITRSIIGVPRQSTFGAIFTVLLDPRLKVQLPPLLVKLDLTIIQQLKRQIGQAFIAPLDKSGLFVAAQVRHYGDTRGNDWYTEVTGYTRGYAQGLLNGVFTAAANG